MVDSVETGSKVVAALLPRVETEIGPHSYLAIIEASSGPNEREITPTVKYSLMVCEGYMLSYTPDQLKYL